MFAVPSDPGVFSDFEYEAIAISYNNSDLVKALEISAFDGKAGSYVIHTDIGQDFVVNDEDLWNMEDQVGLIMPVDKMSFSVKR